MSTKFKDDKIVHIESDIEKIQTSLHMYISYSGSKGAFHLSKEGINNAIDECINPNSPGDEVNIHFDENLNEVTVVDNGRGIPFDKLINVCTTLQSSSKFVREGSGGSAGQNGVGLTAQNAVSQKFELTSYRYGEKASVRFENGKLIEDVKIRKDKSDRHGTAISFVPSEIYLGADCQIKVEDMMDWLEDISCLIPEHIKINLSVNRKGKESVITKKYRNKGGLYTITKRLAEKPILEPIHFMRDITLSELVKDKNDETGLVEHKEVKRFMGLEVAFTFNSSSIHDNEMKIKSFCNFVSTIEHGTHVDAVRTGITQYLSKQAREALTEKEAKKIEIIPQDVTNGLVLSLYVSTDLSPEFTGQTKEKVSNNAFFRPIREMTYNALFEYFKKDPKELKRVTDHIKTNAKARIESNKVKNAVIRGETSNLDMHKMKWFVPANNKGRNDYRELFIVEGESALGSCKSGRFEDFQALFAVRGYVVNTLELSLDKVLENEELKSLIKVLKTKIGAQFDINKLDYQKIIIMTDGDADGFFIFSLICTFFIRHMHEIIEGGYLYKAVPPLYETSDKKKKYTVNRLGYISLFEERIGDNIQLSHPLTGVMVKRDAFRGFLLDNRDYLDELQRLAGHYAANPQLVEFIAIHADEVNFAKKLTKRFPEITVDSDNIVSGIYEGRYQILNMDQIFFKRIKQLRDFIFGVNKGEIYFRVSEKSGTGYVDRGIMSIGDLLTMCYKFRPKIENRFKGLGELDPDKLRSTTLDPNNRTLIQLTMDDVVKEIEKFKVLHGNAADERKQLMAHFKLNREDLDN